jgi:hypothetical protein
VPVQRRVSSAIRCIDDVEQHEAVLKEAGNRLHDHAHADQRDDRRQHATRSLVERHQDEREG